MEKFNENFLPDPPNKFNFLKKIDITTVEKKIENENENVKYYCDDDDDGDEERKEEVVKIISSAGIQSTDLVIAHGPNDNGKS